MRQKNIRVYQNPELGQRVTVTWGDGNENNYPGITEAATALGEADRGENRDLEGQQSNIDNGGAIQEPAAFRK